MPTVATIGVYGFTLERFVATFRGADVRRLLDVRQRRGVRGSEYAWANSARLQSALAEAGVAYRHHQELAPTTELRRLQYREDDRLGVGKRSRVELAPAYRKRYVREILDRVDLARWCRELPARRCGRAVLRRTRSRGVPPVADRTAHGRRARRLGGRTSGRSPARLWDEDALDREQRVVGRLGIAVRAAVEDLHLAERPDGALALRHRPRHQCVDGRGDRAVGALRRSRASAVHGTVTASGMSCDRPGFVAVPFARSVIRSVVTSLSSPV